MKRIPSEDWLEMFPSGRVYEWNSTIESSCGKFYLSHNYWPDDEDYEEGSGPDIDSMLKESGYYSLQASFSEDNVFGEPDTIYDVMLLENMFIDPMKPTEVERELFRLEKGFDYIFPVGGPK